LSTQEAPLLPLEESLMNLLVLPGDISRPASLGFPQVPAVPA